MARRLRPKCQSLRYSLAPPPIRAVLPWPSRATAFPDQGETVAFVYQGGRGKSPCPSRAVLHNPPERARRLSGVRYSGVGCGGAVGHRCVRRLTVREQRSRVPGRTSMQYIAFLSPRRQPPPPMLCPSHRATLANSVPHKCPFLFAAGWVGPRLCHFHVFFVYTLSLHHHHQSMECGVPWLPP